MLRYDQFTRRLVAPIRTISGVLGALACVAAMACLVAIAVHFGYEHSAAERVALWGVMRACLAVFAVKIIFNLTLGLRATLTDARTIRWIADAGILLLLVLWIVPCPTRPAMAWLTFLWSHAFSMMVLALYSIVEVCYLLMRIVGRRVNPSLILTGSFVVLALLGSVVLMLPRCTYGGISYCDSLFVSTSAVCITGLTPVDVASTFTPQGQVVIAVLMQVGGLGVMTFACFFAMFFSGNNSVYSQLLVRDVVYSRSINALLPTLLYVLAFTLVIEGVGAVLIFVSIHGTLGLSVGREIAFSAFHSLSSFCNAGFSILPDGMATPTMLRGSQAIYWVTSLLVIAGGIGFPVLVNLRDSVVGLFKRIHRRRRIDRLSDKNQPPVHIWTFNNKLAVAFTTALFLIGAIAFYFLESNGALAGMTGWQKVSQAVFNSVVPRSAGFTSVNPATFLPPTLLIVMALMVIGGCSQSMAGGIKVNTLAAVLLNFRAAIRGHQTPAAFHRTVSAASMRRAQAVLIAALGALLVYTLMMLILEPHQSPGAVVFETISALFTVGSSMGITGALSDASKVVLTSAMILGRVGILSLLAGLAASHRDASPHYPTDDIIIN